jgi:cAMP-dependent protein kinase regulator
MVFNPIRKATHKVMDLVPDKVMNLVPFLGKPLGSSKISQNAKKIGGEVIFRVRNVFAVPLEITRDFVAPLFPKTDEQVEFLEGAFSEHFVFSLLNEVERRNLINAMELKSVKKNSDVIKQGAKGDYVYVIQQGTVNFIVDGEDKGEAFEGAIIGELALLYDCPRAATVRAKTDCDLWRVSQYTFRKIKAAYALQNDHETRTTIRKVPFLKDLPDEIINRLADSLFQTTFQRGDILARKGEEGETLTIIKEGYVVGTNISIGSQKYADIRLGPGDYFGERPILKGEPNIGTAIAETRGTAWLLSKERFHHTLGHLNLEELIIKSQDKKFLVSACYIRLQILLFDVAGSSALCVVSTDDYPALCQFGH